MRSWIVIALWLNLSQSNFGVWILDFELFDQDTPDVQTANPKTEIHNPKSLTTIGLEGRVLFRHRADQPLRAVPVNDKAPVTLRIADQAEDGDRILYDLRYIAHYAGDFDLRQYLERLDGLPLTDAEPIPVRVGALLPEDHGSDLFEIPGVKAPRLGGYRIALIVIGSLWIVPVVYLIVRRILHRKPAPAMIEDHPLTLGDQLRPLVEEALAGTISLADRARLEMLLVTYWRDQLHLRDMTHIDALQTLRDHREAGEILAMMERWLHRPPSSNGETVDVAGLLSRYRSVSAIELPHAQEVGA